MGAMDVFQRPLQRKTSAVTKTKLISGRQAPGTQITEGGGKHTHLFRKKGFQMKKQISRDALSGA